MLWIVRVDSGGYKLTGLRLKGLWQCREWYVREAGHRPFAFGTKDSCRRTIVELRSVFAVNNRLPRLLCFIQSTETTWHFYQESRARKQSTPDLDSLDLPLKPLSVLNSKVSPNTISIDPSRDSDVAADVQQCESALFEWAESFDTKDWERLPKCLAPKLHVSFRGVSKLTSLDDSDGISSTTVPSWVKCGRACLPRIS